MHPEGSESFSGDSTILGNEDHLEVLPHSMGKLTGNAEFQAVDTCLVSNRVITRFSPGTPVVQ